MNKIVVSISTVLLFVLTYCSVKHPMTSVPSHFPKTVYPFEKQPTSGTMIELGRVLFYDPQLSRDNSTSCASCHAPFNGFAHNDHELSHGIDNQIGLRNAPALFNLAWQSSYMWDGSITDLNIQALTPIAHPKEMDASLPLLITKLKSDKLYPSLFSKAFGDSAITEEKIALAIAQFQLTLISANSKYDKVKRQQAEFTDQEVKGYQLFKQHCNSCHAEPLFSTYEFANNGLPYDTFLKDNGRMAITNNPSDQLKFKIPSLRNLSYTFPYMHDGRFKKLSQVLNHYTNVIEQSSTLAPELKNKIVLSANDKVDLIAFLLSLNDEEFIQNPKHQFPKSHLLTKTNN